MKEVPQSQDDKVLNRVRALLAKAESTTFEEEADALISKAQQLMSRHSIDAAMVDASGNRLSEPMQRTIVLERPYVDSKGLLVSRIARANNCQCVWSYGSIIVFGFEVDLDNVELLFTSLLTQATAAMLRHGSVKDHWGESITRSFRRSFLDGFAERIGERLDEATAHVVKEQQEAAGIDLLPVLASRSERVQQAMEEAFPFLGTRTMRLGDNRDGYLAGRASANTAHFGRRGQISA